MCRIRPGSAERVVDITELMKILQNENNDWHTFVPRFTNLMQSIVLIKFGDRRANCETTLFGAYTDEEPEHACLEECIRMHGRC